MNNTTMYVPFPVSGIPIELHAQLLTMAECLKQEETVLSIQAIGLDRCIAVTQTVDTFFGKDAIVWVALDPTTEAVKGFSSYYKDDILDRVVIESLFVAEVYRQQGIGKALLNQVLKTPTRLFDIHVMNNNPAALATYKSVGFTPFIQTLSLAVPYTNDLPF